MKTLYGIAGMTLWTSLVVLVLYLFNAHDYYNHFGWAVLFGFILLIAHVVNMAIYFNIAGKEPYKWFK
ncbi:MAG: hypothetical protein QF596_09015 [Acidimicrobiales bacterium]|jgi:preprotein translocase subunit SecF|nr:hypothetical protein [Acidimicrobiales bacterium]MDP6298330.1 hypothetical protein [Acidimicrobiales bacterium]HJM28147.1 hypothetical protein [Acidimicrobiales bacterium]HJM98450.1 hypothetical protein [Acidimicrobiales bacterium]